MNERGVPGRSLSPVHHGLRSAPTWLAAPVEDAGGDALLQGARVPPGES